MGLKEDVLEQIVDDYLQVRGYFTRHNLKFKPSSSHPDYNSGQDRVASDVDVVGVNPRGRGCERVWVVTCKAWQGGFSADQILAQLEGRKKDTRRPRWKMLRELWIEKWAEAFVQEIAVQTGSTRFTYYLAVTRLSGDIAAWESHPKIKTNLRGNPLRFLTLETMWEYVLAHTEKTPAASEMGRLAQLLKAAGLTA
jgi:hypothetical protein